ncbi:uncharacterized protein MONBRDRAFT_16773, partial [Monosiga brevicollis MX1]
DAVTFPLDFTKTRMQTALMLPDATALPRLGMIGTAYSTIQAEGPFALWQGLAPAVTRHVIYSGFRVSFYEQIRDRLFSKDAEGHHVPWQKATSGLAAGALAQLIASPADLIKVRMQTQGRDVALGRPKRYQSMRHAFATIVKQEGWTGLYKGCIPNMQRAALVGLGDIATYDMAKHFFVRDLQMPDNWFSHMCASGCSGLAAALLGTPADVVKTRMMNQPVVDGRGVLYKNSIDCLVKTVKAESVFALWRGVLPIWLRMAPWALTFWTVYEQIRNRAGLASF